MKIPAPTRRDLRAIRFLIAAALLTMTAFLVWLLQPSHMGDPLLFWPLTLALMLVVVGWLFEWLYYWQISGPPAATLERRWTVDVFTTACPGEPREMIVRTLLAMKAIRYPHRDYLCDEGNDPLLREVCEKLGIVHVTRSVRTNAKAGNINNALARSDGEICVVLDPDHEPAPYFLDRVLGYFEDPSIGFVQTIQAYRNQGASLIARGAAQMSYHFYGPLMMGMHRFGTAQAIGANCVFRRKALESIGGHAPGLAEDMHTAMRLFSRGWRSAYVPEALTRGQAPSTLASFSKQQLKWSCGVLDLFLGVYPGLFRRFSWRHRLHFLLAPTYFMRGLIGLVSLAVPIAALIQGGIAWRISLGEFLMWALPVVGLVTLVRQASQRFLLERSEHGFHMLGGTLSFGMWWVYLLGNLCSLLRIKIPYIPTPKEDLPEDAWRLALPNLAAAALCIFAIAHGLNRDYSPYTLLMSLFAAWNAGALIFVAMLGQQRTLRAMRRRLEWLRGLRAWLDVPARAAREGRAALLAAVRNWAAVPAVIILAALGQVSATHSRNGTSGDLLAPSEKDFGGFYTGIYLPEADADKLPAAVRQAEEQLGESFRIVSLYQSWGPWSLEHFPEEVLQQIGRRGAVPMITWEPWTESFEQARQNSELGSNRRVFAAILRGDFDWYIIEYARKLRALETPVLMRFAHEPDNPQYPWSRAGGNTPDEFAGAFRYVVDLFNREGASNVGWVYSPWTSAAVERYYPGAGYVDWVGLTLLNYGKAAQDGRWWSLRDLYEPFRPKLKDLALPVMLAEFGSTPYGGDQAAWLADGLARVEADYPEIRSVVFFHSDKDRNWISPWRPSAKASFIDWTFLGREEALKAVQGALAREHFRDGQTPSNDSAVWYASKGRPSRSRAIAGKEGGFRLIVDGEPFYIRGVAYNVGGDWRNGNLPPTRRQLETDIRLIREMGANTIRRYGGGWYDRNILEVAAENDVKVLYGFWLDQELDYATENERLARYEEQVIETVLAYRDHPALLGWSVGNEVWGLLAHRYGQPYLTSVRYAYVRFLERLARRIRALDPNHPVLTVGEHNHQLAGEIRDLALGAPSLDAVGVNTYYERHISELAKTIRKFDRKRPYLISEFGPEGYWHNDYTARDDQGMLLEASAAEKAALYERRWNRYVERLRGSNIGGVAFCWRDRYEGTTTWFGMTDMDGRLKPAYYALRRAWTGRPMPQGPAITSITGPTRSGPPGSEIVLHARVAGANNGPLTYDWRVVGPDYRPRAARIRATDREGEARVTLPDKPGQYRVVLQVRGNHGLDERSYPLLVPEGAAASDPNAQPPAISHWQGRAMTRVHALNGY